MEFRIRYLDSAAMTVSEALLEAADEAEARAQARGRGWQVLAMQRERRWRLGGLGWLSGSARSAARVWRSAELALLCRELSSLVGAGLSVVEALEALAAQRAARQGEPDSLYALILEQLRKGRSLSAAMEDVGGMPPLLIASIRSSERTSNLGQALASYLHYDELVVVLRRKVVSAALYPSIVVSLGLVIAVFLLWVVIPRFAALYGQMGSGAGGMTLALLELSRALQRWPWLVPLALASVGLLIWALVTGGRWRWLLQWITDQVPPLSRQVRHFELTRLFEALAMLTRGGFSFHEALELCKTVATAPGAIERLDQAQAQIARGVSVSNACAAAGLTDEVTQRLLHASERGGDFATVLQSISARHAVAFETFVERATRVVEPILLLGVAVLIGGMVVMLYMPIFDIASSIR